MAKNVMHRLELVKVADALRARCSISEDGFALYADGYSDQKIADELGVTVFNVSGLRKDMFGPIRPARTPKDPRAAEIAALKSDVASLAALGAELQARLAALEAPAGGGQ